MQVKCFSCGTMIEAGDVAALEDVFVAHGQSAHQWSFPEQAVRNYARNCAEAAARLSGETERLAEIGEVDVQEITLGHLEDWLRLFDRDGFAGDPDRASCYCLEPHAPAPPEMPERPWRTTRQMMIDRLRMGTAFGYLAYVGQRPVGWLNASLRSDYALYRNVDPDGPPPATVIGLSCFVVAPPYRRHGVAAAMLNRAVADAAGRGAAWVEAYPHNAPEGNDAGHFRGPRSMYEALGFVPVVVRERDTVMRRAVARAVTAF